MRFMLMFYEPASAPKADLAVFDSEMVRRGVPCSGPSLEAPEAADSIRKTDGSMRRTKGPLPAAPERLEGVRIVECPDQQAAVALAALAPSAQTGSVEVRAIHESPIIPDFDVASR